MADEAGNEAVIREFLAAWSRRDAAELAAYFTDDGTYHNMPAAPVTGRENVETLIRGFSAAWTATEWEVLNLVAHGDLVFAERIDRTEAEGGKRVDLPCLGIFEMRDGRIHVWRDYFDMATYARGLG